MEQKGKGGEKESGKIASWLRGRGRGMDDPVWYFCGQQRHASIYEELRLITQRLQTFSCSFSESYSTMSLRSAPLRQPFPD